MKTRRFLSAIAVSGVVLAGTFVGSVSAASADAADFGVLQLNLCNSGFADCYQKQNQGSESINEAVTHIQAKSPMAVTLNEVCRADIETLKSRLNYEGAFVPVLEAKAGDNADESKRLPCREDRNRTNAGDFTDADDHDYGIGVLVKKSAGPLSLTGHGAYGKEAQYEGPDPNKLDERRVWGCWRAGGYEAFSVCTTHLDSKGDKKIRNEQYKRFMAHVKEATGPVVAGGDLNLSYSHDKGTLNGGVPDGWTRKGESGASLMRGGHVQHVFFSPGFSFADKENLRMDHSDHVGLYVNLKRS